MLYAKNADLRMPPASMAKMMTTDVAFELINKGQLPLNKMCTVRPETWQKWHGPQAGSTMFLSPERAGQRRKPAARDRHSVGQRRPVVLAECIAGTEQAFADQMNALAKKIGLTNSHFGNRNGWPDEGVTYVTARISRRSPRATIERPSRSLQAILLAAELHLGQDAGRGPGHHAGQPQPVARQGRRCRRAQDRAYRRGGLWLYRLGRTERPPADRWSSPASKLECSASRNRRG